MEDNYKERKKCFAQKLSCTCYESNWHKKKSVGECQDYEKCGYQVEIKGDKLITTRMNKVTKESLYKLAKECEKGDYYGIFFGKTGLNLKQYLLAKETKDEK